MRRAMVKGHLTVEQSDAIMRKLDEGRAQKRDRRKAARKWRPKR